ncbi:MAG: FAD-dependent oxidoreductase [Dehalococcoidales bacterium]|nr:FAD-dependent oxidoreductase [Dehalococcoidales bacterium]
MAQRYVIIGTGPAGIAAAEAISEIDPAGELTLIGDDPYGFYSRPGVAYFLTGEVSERQLFLKQADRFHFIKARVATLDTKSHNITTEDGQNYDYDRLLLATGSTASKITIPGADLDGVVKLDNMSDAKEIISAMHKSKEAVVVGGGIIALEIVEALITHRVKTHYLLRSDRYWPNVLDKIESDIVERRLKSRGVLLYYRSELARIIGKRNRVIAVETKSWESIKCQFVGVAIGVQPRLTLAVAAGLKTDRGILTNQYLETSAPDVYAAGDVVQALDPLSGKMVLDTLWGNAVEQGRLAGKNMAGQHTPFHKSTPFNVTRLAGLTTTIIGAVGSGKDADLMTLSRGDSETWRQLPNVMAVQRDFEVNRTRIMLGSNTIVGALVMGDQTLSNPLHQLIENHVDITSIRDDLMAPDADLINKIIEFWSIWISANDTPK